MFPKITGRSFLFLLTSAFCLLTSAFGQSPIVAPYVQTQELDIFAPSPPPVAAISASNVGQPGSSTFYYWVVANYSQGNASPAGPAYVTNASNALSSSNYVTISWSAAPGATSYDVLRTLSPVLPNQAATIAVSTATTALSVNDQGGALSSYTIKTLAGGVVGRYTSSGGLNSSNNVIFVTPDSPGGDIGAKFAACIAASPTTGGTCDLTAFTGSQIWSTPVTVDRRMKVKFGSAKFTVTGALTVNKPLDLEGAGPGNILGLGATEAGTTEFDWSATSGDFITVNPTVTGLVFANFTIVGNKGVSGATTGSDMTLAGGTAQISYVTLERIKFAQAKQYGLRLQGNTFVISIRDCDFSYNALDGAIIEAPSGGAPSQIRFFGGVAIGNSGNGVNVGAVSAGDVEFHGFSSSSNTGKGILGSGSVQVFGGAYESNGSVGLELDGATSTVTGATIIANTGGGINATAPVTIDRIQNGSNTSFDIQLQTGAAGSVLIGTSPFVVNLLGNSATQTTMLGDVAGGLNNRIAASTANSSILLLPTGTGNVGVGTPTPALLLQVAKAMGAALNSVAFSATPTFDASLGNTQAITLTGNVTSSTLSNAQAGEWLVFDITEDATGARTWTWPTNVKGGGSINTAASKHNVQVFYFDGTNAWAASAMQSN